MTDDHMHAMQNKGEKTRRNCFSPESRMQNSYLCLRFCLEFSILFYSFDFAEKEESETVGAR